MRLANSIDIGKVQITTPGRLKMKILMTELSDAPYSVMYCAIRNKVPEPIKTAEKAQMPKIKVRNTSLNIYLSNIRIRIGSNLL
jgi:hypothetical protein